MKDPFGMNLHLYFLVFFTTTTYVFLPASRLQSVIPLALRQPLWVVLM